MEEQGKTAYHNHLALQAGQGDQDAFAELYEYYFPRVYNFIFAKVKNADAADEIISEVFVKAYRKLCLFDPTKAAFSTWLFRLATNAFTDQMRMVQRRQEDGWEEFFDPAAPSSKEPESVALMGEQKQELLKSLDRLNERERRMVELKYWGGLSNIEIADVMGLSVSNVGTSLFRALGKMRDFLTKNS